CSPATFSSGPICSGSNFNVTANHSGGGAPYHYLWSDGVGGIYPDSKTITANHSSGPYSFECIVSDNCGNTCQSNVTITVLESPTISVSPVTGSICSPGGAALTLTAAGANNYTWSPSSGLNVTTGSVVSSLPATSTTYTVTGTGVNGCVSTGSASVSLLPAVTVTNVTAAPDRVCN